MTYSLFGAPALGYALVRLPAGTQVARVLLTARSAGPPELYLLASAHPGDQRAPRWRRALAASRQNTARFTLDPARGALGTAVPARPRPGSAVLQRCEPDPVADLTAMDLLIRHEVLDWTWSGTPELELQGETASRAADVLVDAVAAAYTAGLLPYTARRAMAAPYLSVRPNPLHADGADGTSGRPASRSALLPDALAEMLAALAATTPAQRTAWRLTVDALLPQASGWALAMDEASWAVHVTGREKGAATAQLLAVEAFRRAGFDAGDGARGVWSAISGCLHAAMTADLLSERDHARLLSPWVLALGTPPSSRET
jgi:hypothetical protein